ncbi:MAG: hypothetical protein ACI9VI_001748 [Candidatus Azotimanducaceae bacterium]|jgi:hypothetical protein
MNMLERQVKLGKSLYEINTNVVQELYSLQQKNIDTYIETNREFGSHISEINDMHSAIELQRDYNATLWNNAKVAFKAQNKLISSALSNTRVALKFAYSPAETKVIESAKQKVIAKTKPKAEVKAKAKVKRKARPRSKPKAKAWNTAK